ncbi:hypothetical protein CBR_g48517 [Chara braunii]|uniref:RNA-directed DNA polymerase n=1 Tax=Chara braunii TaxID=69332 RepID=A0A388M324_CHABU|nr:hypothetical protein CBR_g48517 [Chara braunii]|eukprot:GBG88905.1 hypothetical protein CBR_g48517 [Chara braunii]
MANGASSAASSSASSSGTSGTQLGMPLSSTSSSGTSGSTGSRQSSSQMAGSQFSPLTPRERELREIQQVERLRQQLEEDLKKATDREREIKSRAARLDTLEADKAALEGLDETGLSDTLKVLKSNMLSLHAHVDSRMDFMQSTLDQILDALTKPGFRPPAQSPLPLTAMSGPFPVQVGTQTSGERKDEELNTWLRTVPVWVKAKRTLPEDEVVTATSYLEGKAAKWLDGVVVKAGDQFLFTTFVRCLPENIRNLLASEARTEYHSFETLSRKALDLEATLGDAQPTSGNDSKKKKSPQEWKKKGAKLMMVESDGTQTEIDELSDLMDYTENDGKEVAAGSTLAAVVKTNAAGRGKGQPRGQGKAASNQTKQAEWIKAGLDQDVWRDRRTRGACINCGQYGHTQYKCQNAKDRVRHLSRPVASTLANKERMIVTDYIKDVVCTFSYGGGELNHKISFLVSDDLPFDMLLGMYYLEIAKPQFDWGKKVLKHKLPDGRTVRLTKFKASSIIDTYGCLCASAFYNYYKQNQEEGLSVSMDFMDTLLTSKSALCAHLHMYLSFYAPPTLPTDDEVAVGNILAYVTKVAREFCKQRYEDNNAPLMYVRIQVGQAPCSALLDSGSSRNFMSQSFMQRAGLGAQLRRKANPTAMKLADGKTQQLLDCYIEAVPVYFAPHACEPVTFDILDTDFDIIHGMPWLASADHTVNFRRRTLSVRDAFGAEVACTIPLPHPSIRCQVVTTKSFRATCAYEQPEEIGLCFLQTVAVADSSPMDLSSDPRVVRLLDEFTDIFESPTGVVPDRPISHEIILEAGAVPPKGCIYQMSEEELEVLCAQLDDLLAKGWIRPSSSPYGAPVLFVRKKNKDLRLCIDYRKLNAQTVKNAGPLPRIDDLLERLGGAKYFSKLDFKSGYHQISIRSNNRYKSAFKTRYGHFEWVVMPFGLTNAPATFQAAMTNEFHAMLDRFPVIGGSSWASSTSVGDAPPRQVQGQPRQVRICSARAGILGHFVTPEGISPLSDKIQAIQEWSEPQNITDVRLFLGLTGYYQRFIKGYLKIAAHLTKLQCEDRPFDFGEEAWESFLALKAALLSVEVLWIYDPLLPTRVTTDASGHGIGAVLEQHDGVDWHPVEYFSKKVPVVHSIDDARKKELLAFVHTLKRWRHFLLGRSQFRWVTDNNPLVFYKTQDTVNSTIARWMTFIDQFDFFPDHIPGKSNRFADALSRLPNHCTAVYSTFEIDDDLRNSFIRGYQADPEFRNKYANCSSPNPVPSHYRIQKGYLLVHTRGRTFFAYRVILTCVHGFFASSTMLPPPDTLESIARLADSASDFGGPTFSATSRAIASHARFADAANLATIVRTASYDHYRSR